MRIVLTIHHFPPHYSAGAEIYTFRLAQWLIRHGHEVEVVCIESITHGEGGQLEHRHESYEDVPVWRLYFNLERAPDPFRSSFDNPAIGEWFADFLRNARPDVVHINSCYWLSVSVLTAAKELLLPLVVTLHDFWFVCPRITLLKPNGALCRVPKQVGECAWCLATEKRRFLWLEVASRRAAGVVAQRWLVKQPVAGALGIYPDAGGIARRRETLLKALDQADVILAPSEFLRGIFIEQGIDPAKLLHSRYGLDTSHWAMPREPETGASDTIRFSYLGQLAPHKGVHLLVEAFNQLDFSRRPGRLRIHGDPAPFPDYAKSLRGIAAGNPAVEFEGRYDNRRVAEILNETDAVITPSIWYENSPLAIMEALTTGTPVITANLGGMPEMVRHNVNGLLFEAGNVKDLARQLQRLLDESDLLAALAGNAKPVRLIDDEMAQITSLYESLQRRAGEQR